MSEPTMRRMTGGEAVVASLLAHGLDVLFGLPGVQNDWLYNALYDARERIRVIHTRHEQGAAYMALGASLALGTTSVCNVVPGPGVLNASAGLATAYALNAPLLLLSGQIPLSQIGAGLGALHEIPDQIALLRSLTKYAVRAESPAEVPALIEAALVAMHSGRTRPVALEIPLDVLERRAPVDVSPRSSSVYEPPLDEEGIDAAARLIGGARNPMIFVGNGAQDCAVEVRALAEMIEAPVVGYRTGRGILDSRHPLSCVLPEARPLWPQCDLVIALGTSARVPLQSWAASQDRKVVRIDVDPAMRSRFGREEVSVTARLQRALPALLRVLPAHNSRRGSRREEMRELHADWRERSAVLTPQVELLGVIREALGENGIFVDELTQIGFASRIIMPVYHPRTFISTGYMGTLGYGFPTALGVKVVRPQERVLSVTGDGGFLFACAELATAVHHRIPLVTVLFNNDRYGNVQQMQRELYQGRVIASDLTNPDFSRFVSSFGAWYGRANGAEDLGAVLEDAFRAGVPAVVEVPVADMPSVDQFR